MPEPVPESGRRATIFAPATAPGRAAIAVLRLSGPAAGDVCHRLTGRPPPPPRQASLRTLADPASGEPLDRGLVLWWPGPGSVTGEDVLELQVHGSRAVVAALLDVLAELPGLRPAEPGEFSRRAFLAGRLDLTAVEGLADLIAAETRAQASQALRQLEGELGRLYDGWRERLLRALALIEAEIDFAPEEEVPDRLLEAVTPDVVALAAEIEAHLADGWRGERLREGLTVAVIGPPNAGKSSLVNRLARRDVAIVSATPGTTRDVIEVHLDLGGYPVTLLDTAGLRTTAASVEIEGVRRAQARAAAADLRLALLDGALWPKWDPVTLDLVVTGDLIVVNKADLGLPATVEVAGRSAASLSCRSGAGIEGLLGSLSACAQARLAPGARPSLSRSRHRAALQETLAALAGFGAGPEPRELALAAEDLRLAARALGRITGRVLVEDMLERIFTEFCIGK